MLATSLKICWVNFSKTSEKSTRQAVLSAKLKFKILFAWALQDLTIGLSEDLIEILFVDFGLWRYKRASRKFNLFSSEFLTLWGVLADRSYALHKSKTYLISAYSICSSLRTFRLVGKLNRFSTLYSWLIYLVQFICPIGTFD